MAGRSIADFLDFDQIEPTYCKYLVSIGIINVVAQEGLYG